MVGSRVYVGGLPFGVRERDLEKFFKGFGRTRDILIKNGYGFVEFDDYRDADDAVYELNGKELLGERIVVEPARGIERRRDHGGGGGGGRDDFRRPPRFGDKVSVERARGTPRGADMWRDHGRNGAPHPRRARSRDKYGPPTRTDFRLIVENLSSRISWQDLKDFMRQAGEVTYADAHKQRKNEGVVEFASHTDMRNALDKLDNTDLNGRRIKLLEDRRRGGGGGGGGGGGRRSRSSSSRSRSRSRRRTRSRSRSRRSSRSRSRSNSKSRPKSKSPAVKSRSRSKQRSGSAASRSRSPSKSPTSRTSQRNSRERSRSPSKEKASKSKSRSPTPNKDNGTASDHNESVED